MYKWYGIIFAMMLVCLLTGANVKLTTQEGDSALYLATFGILNHQKADTQLLNLIVQAGIIFYFLLPIYGNCVVIKSKCIMLNFIANFLFSRTLLPVEVVPAPYLFVLHVNVFFPISKI